MSMTQIEAKRISREILNKYGLHHWKIGFNKRKSAMGIAYKKEKKIYLSLYLLKYASNEQIIDTIKHEVAHAIDYEKRGRSDHSWRWEIIAREVGANPSRKVEDGGHLLRAIPSKYVYTCENCGTEVTTHRKLKNIDKRSCVKCYRETGKKYCWKIKQLR